MILSAWDIKGNGAGKAFLIIVNCAVHGIAVQPSRRPKPEPIGILNPTMRPW
jgi:hypothetical protein